MHEDPGRESRSADAAGRDARREDLSDGSQPEPEWLRKSGDEALRSAAQSELEGQQDELAVQAKMRGMKLAFWGTIALVLAGVAATLVT